MMSSIILAGGRSSRLAQDKCSVMLAGETLLQRIINCINQVDEEIILALRQGQANPLPSSQSKVKIAIDQYTGKGPLAGIYSGLRLSKDSHSLVVACDMPFLNINLLRYMIRLAPGFDIVIPRMGKLLEPLHAVYSKDCLPTMEDSLKEGNFKVRNLLQSLKVRHVEQSEIDSFDPKHLSWFNINTPADLKRAEQIVEQERDDHR